jgi:repressor LexA
MKGLTEKQQSMLDYIAYFMQTESMAPTVYELAEHFNIKSATALAHLRALQRKGYVNRSSKARSLTLVHAPTPKQDELILRVPLLGRVSAGIPLLAEQQVEGDVVVDPATLPRGAGGHRLFSLRVSGESMRDAGILDGDIVVAKQTSQASIGDVVVAMVDGETTVKWLYVDGRTVELRPANPNYQSLYYPLDKVAIQGVVIALQRTY